MNPQEALDLLFDNVPITSVPNPTARMILMIRSVEEILPYMIRLDMEPVIKENHQTDQRNSLLQG